MSVQLEGLSPKQLQDLIAKAQQQMSNIALEHAQQTREKLIGASKEAGYDLFELFGIGKGKRKTAGKTAAVKFRNPSNPTQTWAGRGKRPRWLVEFISQGGTLEQAAA